MPKGLGWTRAVQRERGKEKGRNKMKCIPVVGNISARTLTYRLCPNTEFSNGKWQMAISVVCLESQVDTDLYLFCTISSSFSVAIRYSKNGATEVYEQPLVTFQLNLKKNTKSINRFSFPLWLNINQISDEVIFTCKNAKDETHLDQNVNAVINVLFRKVE